jgi:hypothetical protein
MAQFVLGQVAKLAYKQRVSLLRHGFEFTVVCGRVFAHVEVICIRKPWLGLPMLPPEEPGKQL